MKKQILFSFFISAIFLTSISSPSAAEKETAQNPADPSFASIDQEDFSADDSTNISQADAAVDHSQHIDAEKSSSDAVISPDEKIQSEKKSKTPLSKTDSSEPVAIPPIANVSSEEMEMNWKALFSKEITSGSTEYVVKPGDSLYVIALKNHTTVDLIKKINGLTSDTIYPEMKFKIQTAPFIILVEKSKNILTLFSDRKPLKRYSVATGKNNSTPSGTFKITAKLVNPTWFKTGAILPPESPENALGTRWLGFDKPGYGIHGTIDPKSIGTQTSEGCIRMFNEQVEELYGMVPFGTRVIVRD